MPLWRVRNSASVAGGVVRALHVFLCFFQASFWQEGEKGKGKGEGEGEGKGKGEGEGEGEGEGKKNLN